MLTVPTPPPVFGGHRPCPQFPRSGFAWGRWCHTRYRGQSAGNLSVLRFPTRVQLVLYIITFAPIPRFSRSRSSEPCKVRSCGEQPRNGRDTGCGTTKARLKRSLPPPRRIRLAHRPRSLVQPKPSPRKNNQNKMAQWPPQQPNYSPQQQQQSPPQQQQQQQPAYLDPRYCPPPVSPKQSGGSLVKTLNIFSSRPSFSQTSTSPQQYTSPQSYCQPQQQWPQQQPQQQPQQPQYGPPVQQHLYQQPQQHQQHQQQQQPHFQPQQPAPQPQHVPPPAYQPPAQPTPPYTPPAASKPTAPPQPDPELARLLVLTTEQEATIKAKTTEVYDAKIENSRLTRVLADKENECARITRELETVGKELVRKSADACEKAEAAEKSKLEAVALQAEIDKVKKKAAETDEELARAKGEAATLRTEVETIHKRALEKDDLAARAQREADVNRAATVEKAAEIRKLRDEVADLQAKALQHSSVACELEAAKAETQKLRKEIVDLQAAKLKNATVERELEAARAKIRTLHQEIDDKVTDETAHQKTWHELQVLKSTLSTKDNEIARLNHVIKSQSVLPPMTPTAGPRPISPATPAYVRPGYVAPKRRDSNASTISSVSAMSSSSAAPYPGFVAPRRDSGATNSGAGFRGPQKTSTLPYPER